MIALKKILVPTDFSETANLAVMYARALAEAFGASIHVLHVATDPARYLPVDAFAALPEEIRRKIAGRRACYSRVRLHHVHYPHMKPLTEQQKRDRPDVWHPLARRHPHTGWTSLYVGRWAVEIEGMAQSEAETLLDYLRGFAIRPEFVYRHAWRVGDAVLWDNRCTQHCATEFDDTRYRRHMLRTTLEGEAPILADAPVFKPAPQPT